MRWQKERQPSYRQARALHISSNVSGHAVRVYWLVNKKLLVTGFSIVLDNRLWHRAISMRAAASPAKAATKQQLIISYYINR